MFAEAERVLQAQLDSLFFPVTRSDLRADIAFQRVEPSESVANVRVRSCAVEHPGGAVAYRVDAEDDSARSVVIAPDSEVALGAPPNSPLHNLSAGAKILIHDAMYTVDEYDSRRGWGHSSHLAAVELALRQKAHLLVLFHHDPDRTDAQVDGMLEESRAAAGETSNLLVVAAYEGLELEL
jgi:ribonuclease BN (tRNA processing enzyme)